MSVGIRIWDLVIGSLSFLDLNQNKLHPEKVYFFTFLCNSKRSKLLFYPSGQGKKNRLNREDLNSLSCMIRHLLTKPCTKAVR